jgi:hypothetical protein
MNASAIQVTIWISLKILAKIVHKDVFLATLLNVLAASLIIQSLIKKFAFARLGSG